MGKRRPKTASLPPVAIVAMGNSRSFYEVAMMQREHHEAMRIPPDLEVWTINAASLVYRSDRVYHMDPVAVWFDGHEWTPETEAFGRTVSVEPWKHMADGLAALKCPVYTAKPDPRVPTSTPYPLKDVVDDLKFPYFNTTVAYAIAHAIHEKRSEIHLYGCDFSYRETAVGEAGRSCAELCIGRAMERGIRVLAPMGTLLDNWRARRILYGYGATLEEIQSAQSGFDSDSDGSD